MVIPPKFEDRILNFLEAKLKSLPQNAKYCTLCIDEMVLKRHLYYDTKRDELIGLHNINGEVTKEVASLGCVLMLRGVVENWKQPIAYSFLASPKHYKELEPWLDEVILKLFSIRIEIQAIVSDQGSNFAKYAKEVKNITSEKPYFMLQDRKIYYIFDVPHLIKCIRNNLLSNDFIYKGKLISWEYIEELYAKQKQKDLRLIPKVTEKHINPNNFQKMRVKYAAQIFSRSVFAAISVLVSNRSLPEDAQYTGDFMQEINNIFDVLNSSKVSCPNKYQKAFSNKQYQIGILEEAVAMFEKIIAIDKKTGKNKTNQIQTFKNIQITIKSVIMLSRDLQEKGIKFIYTRRLNQDCLENFFRAVRQQGGNCTDPTPIQFTRAFSKLFLRNMLQISRTSNCQEDICDLLQRSDTTTFLERPKSGPAHKARIPSAIALNGETDYRFDMPAKNALTYVSGYLLYKCSKKHNCTSFNALLQEKPNVNETTLYTHFKAYNKDSSFYGGLKVPPETFNNYTEELERAFLNNFDNVIMYRPGSSVLQILKTIDFPPICSCFPRDYLLKLFTRFRIFSTIRFNNREFREGKKCINHFIKLKHI
ncbi:unnamed protein product [Parnassius mnemosyne]|uniref:Transposase n=1 Tax=Parnassius mnemosyne TaxID=213953 RepID=A0AAV1LAX2_9NEOP